MKFLFHGAAIAALVCAVSAADAVRKAATMIHMETSKYESRDDFIKLGSADDEQMHEVVFAVKQRNVDKLHDMLMEVSTPKSAKFGQFLSRAEVGNLTANTDATEFLTSYLKDSGAQIVKTTPYGEYISAVAPVGAWEKMFATTFYYFQHAQNAFVPITRAVHYSIPAVLADHVSAVFNTVQMPPRVSPKKLMRLKSDAPEKAGSITPAVLNSYYDITSNTGSTLASQSVFESLGQYYSPSDLSEFETNYDIPQQAIAEDIGGYESDAECTEDANNCIEANLDVQYLIAVSQKTPTTYWYEDAVDSFLAWIQEVAASENPPLVHSISYGAIETEVPQAIGDAFSTEAMKLGLQGVSILVSSGDDGVANFQARSNPNKCGYTPSFPASCPYVTAIGATQGAESGSTEIACTSDQGGVITTGGGFSTLFTAPDYQTDAISNYFKSLGALQQPASGYNAEGRGYPDVSMAGLNYEVVVGGKTYQVSGTSASAPVVAGMVSLVNAARLDAGKSALGFLNPTIYANGDTFVNDVTSGENNCCASKVCCDEGFYASTSWDPLTGFGSVNYAKFYDIFFNL